MIWRKEKMNMPIIPDNHSVEMIGIYYEEGSNVHHTSIEISVTNQTTTTNYVIYSHQAKTLTQQEPSAEDINNRYKAMFDKYYNLYNNMDYDLINFKKFRSYTPEAPSL